MQSKGSDARLYSTFHPHFVALNQTLPAGASGEEVRTVIAYGIEKEGAMEFDVLYGSSCYEDIS